MSASSMPTPYVSVRKTSEGVPRNCFTGATQKATSPWFRIFSLHYASTFRRFHRRTRAGNSQRRPSASPARSASFCLGLRSTYSVAYIFHYVRSLFGGASVLVDGIGGTGTDALRTIGRYDVLLAITVRPYTRQTISAAQYASGRGAKVVAITESEISPLASIASETLIIGTETPSFFPSMTPAFATVECLAALVAARRGSETLKSLAQSEEQLSAFDTYVLPSKASSERS